MISTDKIAVVILNWNGCEMMRQFLPSVVAHSADEGLVIVADNGSTDDSLTMLAQEFPSVVSLKLNENFGFAEGYNQALKQIDAPYYLLLNSDVEVTEGWLHPLLNYMESHPEVAACMPKLLSQKIKKVLNMPVLPGDLSTAMATLTAADASLQMLKPTTDSTKAFVRCSGQRVRL